MVANEDGVQVKLSDGDIIVLHIDDVHNEDPSSDRWWRAI